MREHQVNIKEHEFNPAVVKIQRYEKVIWHNYDGDIHSVIFVDKSLMDGGGIIESGRDYHHTFNVPGQHDYFDQFHPKMSGKIIVENNDE